MTYRNKEGKQQQKKLMEKGAHHKHNLNQEGKQQQKILLEN